MTRVSTLAGRSIAQHNSPNRGGPMADHRGIVLHIAQGTYQGTIAWQLNPDQRYADGTQVTTCSTWVVGREPGEWAQMVDTDDIAWCQRDGSRTWHSIELAGFAPAAPSAWQVEACAQLLAWHHRRYGTPLEVTSNTGGRGLGHHSMDNDTTVEWGHDECPGAGVVNAKAAIVARAREIVEEEDMPSADEIADAVWAKSWGSPTQGIEDMSARDWLKPARLIPALRAEVAGLAAAVAGEDVPTAVRAVLREELAALGPALAEHLDGVTVEQITEALSRLRLVADSPAEG